MRTNGLKKNIEEFGLAKKWEETSLAKKIAIRTRRAKLNDFERFQALLARKELARKTRQGATLLRKANKSTKKDDKSKGAKDAGKAKGGKKWGIWKHVSYVSLL